MTLKAIDGNILKYKGTCFDLGKLRETLKMIGWEIDKVQYASIDLHRRMYKSNKGTWVERTKVHNPSDETWVTIRQSYGTEPAWDVSLEELKAQIKCYRRK